jgi:hypothetical protein
VHGARSVPRIRPHGSLADVSSSDDVKMTEAEGAPWKEASPDRQVA